MPTEWQPVTTLLPLGAEELQLWQIRLDDDPTALPHTYRQHLSPDELDRADRLRKSSVKIQFLAARAALRLLLGNLLCTPPNKVPITLGPYGKPETADVDGVPLFFNVAHSRTTVLIALCRCSQVGVDVEHLDRATDVLEIARNSFAPGELNEIMKIGDPLERQHAFFRCWTRKEAVIKADGRGLSVPLDLVEVPVNGPAHSAVVLIKEEYSQKSGREPWFVTDIALDEELAAAFAVRIAALTPRTFNFPLAMFSGQ